MRKKIYTEVKISENDKPSLTPATNEPSKISRAVLIANTHRVVVRAAKLTKRDRWLTPKNQWRLVQESFPLGMMLNENTHIFDGSLFINKAGQRCFTMFALPKAISEAVAEISIAKWGNIHKLQRLDTIEHLLFKYYTRRANKTRDKNRKPIKIPKSQWVIFPQDLGFRVLFLNDGLPCGAYYVSNHLTFREIELERVWGIATPSSVTILTRSFDDDALANEGSDTSWIQAFVQSRGDIEITNEIYKCPSQFD